MASQTLVEVNPYLGGPYAPIDTEIDASDLEVMGEIPRHGQGSEIKWFEAEPCYVYHSVNAWEEDDEVVLDLSRIGRPNRYVYNVHISPESTLLFDGIVKYDVTTGTDERWWCGPGRWASESPFAPRANAVSDDDGYLVSFVYDQLENRSEVVILDAADITSGPVARVLLPQRVPIGFHATWVPGWKL